jgi:hypothetical protein
MGLLREIFGPSREEIWRQLSEEIDAEYIAGGFFQSPRVVASHREWTITLDVYTTGGKNSTTYTRIRAPYVNRDGFRFGIYRKGFFSDLGKWLGMQDVEVGYPRLDEEFIIQGNDVEGLKALFDNHHIRRMILEQPSIHLEVRGDEGWFFQTFPDGVDELYFRVHGVIRDVGRLRALFDLFAEVLDHLCRIGSAYEDDPRLEH